MREGEAGAGGGGHFLGEKTTWFLVPQNSPSHVRTRASPHANWQEGGPLHQSPFSVPFRLPIQDSRAIQNPRGRGSGSRPEDPTPPADRPVYVTFALMVFEVATL